MLRSGVRLLITALVLFAAAIAIRFIALLRYPEYIGPAHLVSSILLGLTVIPIILLAVSSRFTVTADVSPGIMRTYKIVGITIAATVTFLGSYYGYPPLS